MSNIEWTVPHLLTTPQGPLAFNQPISSSESGILLLDEQKCSAAPTLRIVTDDVPQADGSILHETFKSGYAVHLGFQMYEAAGSEAVPACREVLRGLWDYIMLCLNSLVNPDVSFLASGQTRLQWTPSGYPDDRMYDRVELLEWPTPTYEGGGLVSAVFALHTSLPYALDLTTQSDMIALASPTLLHNPGSAGSYPVFRVHGPMTSCSITNETTGQQIGYDSSLPGGTAVAAGHYAEINTFTNTANLDGDGANLIASIDANTSEFFPLAPGANEILYTGDGGELEVLWNAAWA